MYFNEKYNKIIFFRFNFHLPFMVMGLNKEDLSMLAKSNLASEEIKSIKKDTLNNDIYSVDDI